MRGAVGLEIPLAGFSTSWRLVVGGGPVGGSSSASEGATYGATRRRNQPKDARLSGEIQRNIMLVNVK